MQKTPALMVRTIAAFALYAAVAQAADAPPVAPDNTGINERDRSGRTLTPLDQSQSSADIKLAAAVRRAIVAAAGLSVSGRNVKVITRNGQVTLRGPVRDEAEKAAVEKAARQAAGAARLDSQLEVVKQAATHHPIPDTKE